MTSIIDGPAKGRRFLLGRTPLFLRLARGAGGEWAALSRPEDEAGPWDELFVYRKKAECGFAHLDMCRRGKRRSQTVRIVHYEFLSGQPSDEVMRDNRKWKAWCWSRPEAKDFDKEKR